MTNFIMLNNFCVIKNVKIRRWFSSKNAKEDCFWLVAASRTELPGSSPHRDLLKML